MYSRLFVLALISTFILAIIYSSVTSDLYALKVKSVKLCEKSSADGINTETCCQLETDSSTEKTTQYCTECKTTSKGEDLGCTHSQTDVGLTIKDGRLGIKTIGPEVSIDKLSDGNQVGRDEIRKDLDTRKELESDDKLGNFEIQDLLGDKENKTID